jgi:hypothetical protein
MNMFQKPFMHAAVDFGRVGAQPSPILHRQPIDMPIANFRVESLHDWLRTQRALQAVVGHGRFDGGGRKRDAPQRRR